MSYYKPDCWVVLKLPKCYKILAGWSGGYLDGDAWRINSGVTRVDIQRDWRDEEYLVFHGHTGSEYWCRRELYRPMRPIAGIYNQLKEKYSNQVEIMPEDTDWLNMKWEIE